MQISNRALGLTCAAVICATAVVRSHTSSAGAESVSMASTPVDRTAAIPDSNFGVLQTYGAVPSTNIVYTTTTGTSNQQLANQNQSRVVGPNVPYPQGNQPPAPPQKSVTTTTTTTDMTPEYGFQTQVGDDEYAGSENSGDWVNDRPVDVTGNIPDRSMYDLMLGATPEAERGAFRATWLAMTPAERQQMIDSMR